LRGASTRGEYPSGATRQTRERTVPSDGEHLRDMPRSNTGTPIIGSRNRGCTLGLLINRRGGVQLFDLMTTTGVLFTYVPSIPDPSTMQMVDFAIYSPFTESASVLSVNVATAAMLGKSIEQLLVDHVEHYEQIAARRAAEQ